MTILQHIQIFPEGEKEEIRQMLANMLSGIEKDNFAILTETGKKSIYGELDEIRVDRSSRLLELLLIGYDVTENRHWLKIYEEKLKRR